MIKIDISLSELADVKGIGQKTLQRIREHKLADEGYVSKYDPDLHLDINSVNKGDCLNLMNGIKDKSIDMILADLPYGTTACSWDSIIDLDKLWLQYERIIKDNGAIVLTASQPFTSKLIMSNPDFFKCEWIWDKKAVSNPQLAKMHPLKCHEEILVFGENKTKYNPQGLKMFKGKTHQGKESELGHIVRDLDNYKQKKTNYPKTIQYFKQERGQHPTQKPVKLFKYLIKTYTNEGDLILDNVAGSGTTGTAAKNLNRNYILIEQEQKYIDVINERLG